MEQVDVEIQFKAVCDEYDLSDEVIEYLYASNQLCDLQQLIALLDEVCQKNLQECLRDSHRLRHFMKQVRL